MSPFPTVKVTAMLVLAKARSTSEFASKSFPRSIVVWDFRKDATLDDGGRLTPILYAEGQRRLGGRGGKLRDSDRKICNSASSSTFFIHQKTQPTTKLEVTPHKVPCKLGYLYHRKPGKCG